MVKVLNVNLKTGSVDGESADVSYSSSGEPSSANDNITGCFCQDPSTRASDALMASSCPARATCPPSRNRTAQNKKPASSQTPAEISDHIDNPNDELIPSTFTRSMASIHSNPQCYPIVGDPRPSGSGYLGAALFPNMTTDEDNERKEEGSMSVSSYSRFKPSLATNAGKRLLTRKTRAGKRTKVAEKEPGDDFNPFLDSDKKTTVQSISHIPRPEDVAGPDNNLSDEKTEGSSPWQLFSPSLRNIDPGGNILTNLPQPQPENRQQYDLDVKHNETGISKYKQPHFENARIIERPVVKDTHTKSQQTIHHSPKRTDSPISSPTRSRSPQKYDMHDKYLSPRKIPSSPTHSPPQGRTRRLSNSQKESSFPDNYSPGYSQDTLSPQSPLERRLPLVQRDAEESKLGKKETDFFDDESAPWKAYSPRSSIKHSSDTLVSPVQRQHSGSLRSKRFNQRMIANLPVPRKISPESSLLKPTAAQSLKMVRKKDSIKSVGSRRSHGERRYSPTYLSKYSKELDPNSRNKNVPSPYSGSPGFDNIGCWDTFKGPCCDNEFCSTNLMTSPQIEPSVPSPYIGRRSSMRRGPPNYRRSDRKPSLHSMRTYDGNADLQIAKEFEYREATSHVRQGPSEYIAKKNIIEDVIIEEETPVQSVLHRSVSPGGAMPLSPTAHSYSHSFGQVQSKESAIPLGSDLSAKHQRECVKMGASCACTTNPSKVDMAISADEQYVPDEWFTDSQRKMLLLNGKLYRRVSSRKNSVSLAHHKLHEAEIISPRKMMVANKNEAVQVTRVENINDKYKKEFDEDENSDMSNTLDSQKSDFNNDLGLNVLPFERTNSLTISPALIDSSGDLSSLNKHMGNDAYAEPLKQPVVHPSNSVIIRQLLTIATLKILRNPMYLFFGLLIPLLLPIIFAILMWLLPYDHHPNCHIPGIELASMGLMSFLRSCLCNVKFTCYEKDTNIKFPIEGSNETLMFLRSVFKDSRILSYTIEKFTSESEIDFESIKDELEKTALTFKKMHELREEPLSNWLCGSKTNFHDANLYVEKLAETLKGNPTKDEDICTAFEKLLRGHKEFPGLERLQNFLKNKVFFYPNTEITYDIMLKVSHPIEKLEQILNLILDWKENDEKKMKTLMSNGSESITKLTYVLDECIKQNSEDNLLLDDCKKWKTYINNNEQIVLFYDNFLNILMHLKEFLENCVTFEKHFSGYADLKEFENAMQKEIDETSGNVFGIIFDGLPNGRDGSWDNSIISVTYRAPAGLIGSTKYTSFVDANWNPEPYNQPEHLKYVSSAFLDIQNLVEQAIVETLTNSKSLTTINSLELKNDNTDLLTPIQMKLMPTICYKSGAILMLFREYLPVFVVSILFLIYVKLCIYIIDDKKTQRKQLFHIIGVSNLTYWFHYFCVTFLILLFFNTVIGLIVFAHQVYRNSHITLLVFLLMSYSQAQLYMVFLVCVICDRKSTAIIVTAVVYILPILIDFSLDHQRYDIPYWSKFFLCLTPYIGLSYGCSYIRDIEVRGSGVTWLYYYESAPPHFNIEDCVIMLWLDAFIYGCTMLYIDACFPGKYGIPRPLCFPCCRSSKKYSKRSFPLKDIDTNFEVGLEAIHLHKKFRGEKKATIDNFNAVFYRNQITSIFGTEGCGKTTLVTMLAGMCAPSSGYTKVNGEIMKSSRDFSLQSVGYCPQNNMLINELTPEEHVILLGKIKGLSDEKIILEVELCLAELNLMHKAQLRCKHLSIGQTRKLSVLLAFIGDNSLVVLDEPSMGADSSSRKSIWDIILTLKVNKTIIISSSNMDDANALGDQIAVISGGKLKAYGTNGYVLNYYGNGYKLFLEKDNNYGTRAHQRKQNLQLLEDFLTTQLDGIQLLGENKSVILFLIPQNLIISGEGVAFLKALETDDLEFLRKFHISSFRISNTSLTDLLEGTSGELRPSAKLSENLEKDFVKQKLQAISSVFQKSKINEEVDENLRLSANYKFLHINTKKGGFVQQFNAVFIRKINDNFSSALPSVIKLFIPIVILIIGTALSLFTFRTDFPPLQVHPWWMTRHLENKSLETFFAHYENTSGLIEPLGNTNMWTGTKCFQSQFGYGLYPEESDYCYYDVGSNWVGEQPNFSALVAKNLSDCICSHNFKRCTSSAMFPNPRQKILKSGDVLFDLNGYNLPEYLVRTYYNSVRRRFGGLEEVMVMNNEYFNLVDDIRDDDDLSNIFGEFGNGTENADTFIDLFESQLPARYYTRVHANTKGYHSLPAYLNMAHNFQLRSKLRKGTPYTLKNAINDTGIITIVHPLDYTPKDSNYFDSKTVVHDMIFACILCSTVLIVSAYYGVFMLRETWTGSKDMQIAAGLSISCFWVFNFITDILHYTVFVLLISPLLLLPTIGGIFRLLDIPVIMLIMWLSGPATLCLLYILTFIIKTRNEIKIYLLNIALGAVPLIITIFIYCINIENSRSQLFTAFDTLFAVILPQYCLTSGIYTIVKESLWKSGNEMSLKDIGFYAVVLAIQAFVLILLTIIIDMDFFGIKMSGKKHNENEDCDPKNLGKNYNEVARERIRMKVSKKSNDFVKLYDVSKTFSGMKIASVDNVAFGVRPAESFGILGVPGSGKTTILKLIIGVLNSSKGKVEVNGHDIARSKITGLQSVGYCPQTVGILPNLTAAQTLSFFCRLKGIKKKDVSCVVATLLALTYMTRQAHKKCGFLSPGMQKRLATSIAFIGSPDVVILDEPFAGMDVIGKRYLSEQIQRSVDEYKSVIVTSSSMYQFESICTRMAYLEEGSFKLLGSVHHMLKEFGYGYVASVKFTKYPNPENPVLSMFPDACTRLSIHMRFEQYQFDESVPVYSILNGLNKLLQNEIVESYSVTQSTLEDAITKFTENI